MRILPLLLIAIPACAQNNMAVRGEQIFQTHCSVPYCHGSKGTTGRAPKLAGHKFNAAHIFDVVAGGIQNRGMPAFSTQLKTEEIEAVVTYLMSMKSGASDSTNPEPSSLSLPAGLEVGKALFFDAVRMGGCGRCHELEQRGSAVAPDLTLASARVSVRSIGGNRTMTARPSDEGAFPVLVVEKSQKWIRVFDLSSPLPVLRTFKPNRIDLTPGSSWQHHDVVSGYNDSELQSIEEYVQWVSRAKH